jgi:hypothetical protein
MKIEEPSEAEQLKELRRAVRNLAFQYVRFKCDSPFVYLVHPEEVKRIAIIFFSHYNE